MGELWERICPIGRVKVCMYKEFYLGEAVEDLCGPLREIFSQLSPKQGELKFVSEVFSSFGI